MLNFIHYIQHIYCILKNRFRIYKNDPNTQKGDHPSGIQSLKTQIIIFVLCFAMGFLALDFNRRSVQEHLWEETEVPLELFEEALLSRRYQRKKLEQPISTISEIKMGDFWTHKSNAWVIAFGELFVSPAVLENTPVPEDGWTLHRSNLQFWKEWIILAPGRSETRPKKITQRAILKKQIFDPREFTF